jgi:hypothetical protein
MDSSTDPGGRSKQLPQQAAHSAAAALVAQPRTATASAQSPKAPLHLVPCIGIWAHYTAWPWQAYACLWLIMLLAAQRTQGALSWCCPHAFVLMLLCHVPLLPSCCHCNLQGADEGDGHGPCHLPDG